MNFGGYPGWARFGGGLRRYDRRADYAMRRLLRPDRARLVADDRWLGSRGRIRPLQARPMVRAAAGLDGDENRRKPLEVADHLGSPELAADNHHLVLIRPMKVEN
jgi:hypothetical protein